MRLRATARATPVGAAVAAVIVAAIVVVFSVKPWNGNSLTFHSTRLMLLLAAIGVAFAFDDPAASTVAASPTALPRRRLMRVAVMIAAAVAGVAGLAVIVHLLSGRAADVPVGAALLEGAALIAVGLAASGMSIRRSESGATGGPAAMSTLVTLAIVLVVLGDRFPAWSALASPGDEAWAQSRWMWGAVLTGSTVLAAWLSRDPASRPVAARLNRT